MRKILVFLFCITLLTGCGAAAKDNAVSDINNKVAVKEVTDKRTPEKKFVEDDLDPLIKSASSLTDSTWVYNVTDPLDNYKQGTLSKDSVTSDLDLAVKLFEAKAKELDDFLIPENLVFHEDQIFNDQISTYIKDTLTYLSKSIRSRGDAVKYYIKAVNSDKIKKLTQEEMDNLLIDSNTNLGLATVSYKFILENVE